MATLTDTAQMVMDLYYQNYKSREDFFSLKHFIYLCGVAYSKLLEDEYKEARALAKLEEGFTDIFMSEDWMVYETITLKPVKDEPGSYVGNLRTPVFAFPYDPYNYGIQSVRQAGQTGCTDFIRTSYREMWMNCLLPVVTGKVFFYPAGNQLHIGNAGCKIDKLIVSVVPEITSGKFEGSVPASKQDTIIRKTWELMARAKEGIVVDTSNNSNPNKAMATEVDSMFSNLRTKP
jgi:hypothetical protein